MNFYRSGRSSSSSAFNSQPDHAAYMGRNLRYNRRIDLASVNQCAHDGSALMD